MPNVVDISAAPQGADKTRDAQAKLYREIGISAVAAALQSINTPLPGRPADEATRPCPPADLRVADVA